MAEPVLAARPFERLSRLNGYQVERHHVDPRGWTVVNAEGRSIGEVKDLIIDTERMAAAYLDVELDTNWFDLHDDPRVFVPMHRAERDGQHRRLRVDGLTRERVTGLTLAREAHYREFWNRWWNDDATTAGVVRPSVQERSDWPPTVARPVANQDLQRAIESMEPGETVRIPVVNEELVVERRVVAPDDARPLPTEGARPVPPSEIPPRTR